MEENQRRKALYEQLGLPAPAIEQLERVKKTFDTKQMQESIERLTAASTAREAYLQLREKLQEDEDGWKMLLCQLEAAELCRENYQRQEIGEEIFVDTMRCFSRFIRECYEMSGRFAFDRGWWTWRQLCMSLFRLGDFGVRALHRGRRAGHQPAHPVGCRPFTGGGGPLARANRQFCAAVFSTVGSCADGV